MDNITTDVITAPNFPSTISSKSAQDKSGWEDIAKTVRETIEKFFKNLSDFFVSLWKYISIVSPIHTRRMRPIN